MHHLEVGPAKKKVGRHKSLDKEDIPNQRNKLMAWLIAEEQRTGKKVLKKTALTYAERTINGAPWAIDREIVRPVLNQLRQSKTRRK